jgi:hypothetical protein
MGLLLAGKPYCDGGMVMVVMSLLCGVWAICP